MSKPHNLKVQELIDEDTSFGCTPDLPQLRYGGVTNVFLYDNMMDNIQQRIKFGFEPYTHMIAKEHNACTVRKFVPFRDAGWDKRTGFQIVCPPETEWPKHMAKGQLLSDFDTTPRPLKGKIVQVSIEARLKLDSHYCH